MKHTENEGTEHGDKKRKKHKKSDKDKNGEGGKRRRSATETEDAPKDILSCLDYF